MPRKSKKDKDSDSFLTAPFRLIRSGGDSLTSSEKSFFLAILFALIDLFLILSAFGAGGAVGSFSFQFLYSLIGLGYWIIVILFLFFFYIFLRGMSDGDVKYRRGVVGSLISFFALLGIFSIIDTMFISGGSVGEFTYNILIPLFGVAFSTAVLVALFFAGIVIGLFPYISSFGDAFSFRELLKRDKDDDMKISSYDEGDDYDEEEEEYDEEEEYEEEEDADDEEIDEEEEGEEEEEEEDDGEKEKENISERMSRKSKIKYVAPPASLLKQSKGAATSGNVKARANELVRTFDTFGISIAVEEVSVGPSITRFAVKPAEGIRLRKILELQTNIELTLAAHPIRIEAPIPGKSLVGIEVPNEKKATVGLGPIIDSKEFKSFDKPLPIIIGRGIDGSTKILSIARLPHLLVAGTTGSGKSVVMHNIVLSLIYNHSPDDVRFILIDPKRVEFTLYEGIPHLITPVITTPKKAIGALNWAVQEMERRYEILQKAKCRDIGSYISKGNTLPYIVVIVDELADLMQTYPRELEANIVRLAQMSRAVGIHIILSTQRPSVNVITGLIKANIPSRIALQVSSQIDSRTIIDGAGAETLLGSGDLLCLTGDISKPQRFQSAFIEENEVKGVVKYLKDKYASELGEDELIISEDELEKKGGGASGGGSNDEDDLYDDAKRVVIEADKASTSLLQRRLKVGYSRAARLIDMLEDNGIIGPQQGSKGREVYKDKETE